MNKLQVFEKAISYYGLKETLKSRHNPKVLKMVNKHQEFPITKNIPWCAAFVNYVLDECGYQHSTMLTARSQSKIGKSVKEPELGDVVILWRGRPDSWKGHTGFFVRETENLIYILGGNQDNSVCIKPYSKSRLLSYRSITKKK